MSQLILTMVAQFSVEQYVAKKSCCQTSKISISQLKTPKHNLCLHIKALVCLIYPGETDNIMILIGNSRAVASHGLL